MILSTGSLQWFSDHFVPESRRKEPDVNPLYADLRGMPAALFTLVREHGARREDLASVRLCVSGGDKVAPELEREFTELAGFPIDEIYGMSEIGLSNLRTAGSCPSAARAGSG